METRESSKEKDGDEGRYGRRHHDALHRSGYTSRGSRSLDRSHKGRDRSSEQHRSRERSGDRESKGDKQKHRQHSLERDREEARKRERQYQDEKRHSKPPRRYADIERDRNRDHSDSREHYRERHDYRHKPDRALPEHESRRVERSDKERSDLDQLLPRVESRKQSRADELHKRNAHPSSRSSSRDSQAHKSHSRDQKQNPAGLTKASKPVKELPIPRKKMPPVKPNLSVAMQSLTQISEEEDGDASASRGNEPVGITISIAKPSQDEAQKLSGHTLAVQGNKPGVERLTPSVNVHHPGHAEARAAGSGEGVSLAQLVIDEEAAARFKALQAKLPRAALHKADPKKMPLAEPLADPSFGHTAPESIQPEEAQFENLPAWIANPEATGPSHKLWSETQQSAPQRHPGFIELRMRGKDDEEEIMPAAYTDFQATAQQQDEQNLGDGVSAGAEKVTEKEEATALPTHALVGDSIQASPKAAVAIAALEAGLEAGPSTAEPATNPSEVQITPQALDVEVVSAHPSVLKQIDNPASEEQDKLALLEERAKDPKKQSCKTQPGSDPAEAAEVRDLHKAGQANATEPSHRVAASSFSVQSRSTGTEIDGQHAVQKKDMPGSGLEGVALARKQRHGLKAVEPKSPFQKGRKLADADEGMLSVVPATTEAANPLAQGFHDDFNSDTEHEISPDGPSRHLTKLPPIAEAMDAEEAAPNETIQGTAGSYDITPGLEGAQPAKKIAESQVAAATKPSESIPPEGLPDPKEDSDNSVSDNHAPIKQPAKDRGKGRSQLRGRAARGASGRGASTKATAGRGKPSPRGSVRGRGSTRGRGRGGKAPVKPIEEALQKDAEPAESLPLPEPVQPKPAEAVLPKTGKRPRLEDELAEEASILETAAPVVKSKVRKARGRPPKTAETPNEEQSADPVSKTIAPITGDVTAASRGISPALPPAEAFPVLAPEADLEGEQQIAAGPASATAPQSSKAVEQPLQLQQPDTDAQAVAGSTSPAVETQHFVRRSIRGYKPGLDSLLYDQPASQLLEDFSALGNTLAIQSHGVEAQQKDGHTQRLDPEAFRAPVRTVKSAKDLHEHPEPAISAEPARRTTPDFWPGSFEPQGRGRPRGKGRARGRGREAGRSTKPSPRRAHSEEPVLPITGPAPEAQTAPETAQAEAVPAQAATVQPQPVVEAAEFPLIPKEPELLPAKAKAQQARAASKQVSKKAPRRVAKKTSKMAAGSKGKAQPAANVGPSKARRPSTSSAEGLAAALQDSGPSKPSEEPTLQSSKFLQEIIEELGPADDDNLTKHLFHLLQEDSEVEGEDEDLPLDALFNEQPEGGEGLSLRDVKALLKAPPSDLKFPDRYEWKQEPIQNEFKTVTKDIQDLFLQLKESKKAAVEEEKAYAKSMQKVDEDMRAEIQELQARIAAEQAKIDKTRAERLAMEAEEEKEEAEFQEEMARIKARQVAVHAEKKASMKRLGLVEMPASDMTSNEENFNNHIQNSLALPASEFQQLVITAD